MKRPNKVEYFMNIARFAATRSSCLRHQVGAILVLDDHIIASGYNGVPTKILHCADTGCSRVGLGEGERLDLCKGVLASTNAIIQTSMHGAACKGATLYITHRPYYLGCKHLINAGIKKIIYDDEVKPDEKVISLLTEANIEIKKY